MINIKPKELQEKQFAEYKNYKKSKIDKTKTKLKSMHIQINKQKCILKLFCLVYLICI